MNWLYLLFFFWVPLIASPGVLVSVPPQKYLVDRIGGGRVPVAVIVPRGMSPHSYEPTPQQVVALEGHLVWFRLGEPFEERLLSLLSTTQVIDQREGLDVLYSEGCCCMKHKKGADSHLWTSPRFLQQMALQIRDTLSIYWPEEQQYFQANTALLLHDLVVIDQWIRHRVGHKTSETLLVTHPAFGYFCRDYGLLQISLEQEGKEPTARQLIQLVERLKTIPLNAVILEPQHPVKGGLRVAQLLGLRTVVMDPYSENVLGTLYEIAQIL